MVLRCRFTAGHCHDMVHMRAANIRPFGRGVVERFRSQTPVMTEAARQSTRSAQARPRSSSIALQTSLSASPFASFSIQFSVTANSGGANVSNL
jgi:hypothetical protein